MWAKKPLYKASFSKKNLCVCFFFQLLQCHGGLLFFLTCPYTMFISNNHALCRLWWKENLTKHQKVSKYYENDCRCLWHSVMLTRQCTYHGYSQVSSRRPAHQLIYSTHPCLLNFRKISSEDISKYVVANKPLQYFS